MRAVTTSPTSPAAGAFRLTDEHVMLRDAVRELADERIAPRAADIDRTGEFPEDLRKLLAEHDILALPFPTEHGGLGGQLLSICLAIEQADPGGPGARLAPDHARRQCRATGPLVPEARQRGAPHRVRPHRGRGRLGRRGRTDDGTA
jgi:alkylation response protein AidB-like acyl-CoA dehydrogenase